jgi:hypothetical protein
MNSVLSSFRFFTDQPWTIPLIGLLVAFLAFLVGRRWFVAQPTPQPEPPEEEPSSTLLTASLQKPPPPERRSAPRRKGGNRVEVFLTDESKEATMCGWVVDRSLGGLCLNVEQPLLEGSVWNVRPRKAPQTAPWLVVEVRSCRPEGTEWEVGFRFLKQPQWNDLLLFG